MLLVPEFRCCLEEVLRIGDLAGAKPRHTVIGIVGRAADRQLAWSKILAMILFLIMAEPWRIARAQDVNPSNSPALTTQQVVESLVARNLQRQQALQSFRGTRKYRAAYQGVGDRSAEMIVTVNYVSPDTKEFTIKSATGSKLIIDRVFKKLLEAEKEALNAAVQRRSALTEENYSFAMAGYEEGAAGARYVLSVEPRTKEKFLYRGRIWVDATDFAIVRLEAKPAKNPSFWTKNTDIVQVYQKLGDFWLPMHNSSVSSIRLGGHAELSIEYSDYEIKANRAIGVAESLH